MNLIQFLAMKLQQGPVFIDRFQEDFREGRPKSVVVSDIIAAVHQLILQDRHVTYREIETTLGISGTSIHSIFHENLTVKTSLSIAQKQRLVSIGRKKCS